MIPLRDTIPSRRLPIVTATLAVANVAVFLKMLGAGPSLPQELLHYGIVPIRYTSPEIAAQFTFWEQAIPFITTQFLHGGWLHLLSNVWFLWIFGDNVEDKLGRLRFLVFYLACGALAAGAHILANPSSAIPTIGASGAIAGVLGAYLLFYPRARVTTLVPIFIFVQIVEIPAFFFIGIWALTQFLLGTASLGGSPGGGVAWWAHVGGLAAGMLLAPLMKRR
jgi:membrane associated rhomboid family serine protease